MPNAQLHLHVGVDCRILSNTETSAIIAGDDPIATALGTDSIALNAGPR